MSAERPDGPLRIALIGRSAPWSAWSALLREDGVPHATYDCLQDLPAAPDLAVFLGDSGVGADEWTGSAALFENQVPAGAHRLCHAFAEQVHDGHEESFVCPFYAEAVDWPGPSQGSFLVARAGESPRYPVVCIDGPRTFLVGELGRALVSQGLTFQPVTQIGEEEIRQPHPPARRERLLRFLRRVLWSALDRAGLPALRLAPAPAGEGLPFLFRVDVDYLIEPTMSPIRRWASRLGWKVTAFVNLSGEERWENSGTPPPEGVQPVQGLAWLAAFAAEGHEVASHGLRHALWPQYQAMLEDLTSARSILEHLSDSEVVGHAFAGGLWHAVAARAAADTGFAYTSEASVAWGGNPFQVTADGGLLQVPCSPAYPAFRLLGTAGYQRFLDFFSVIAAEAAQHGEPLSWMGHPFDLEDAPPALWEGVEETRRRFGFRPSTMAALSQRAHRRAEVMLSVERRDGGWWVSSSRRWEALTSGGRLEIDRTPRRLS